MNLRLFAIWLGRIITEFINHEFRYTCSWAVTPELPAFSQHIDKGEYSPRPYCNFERNLRLVAVLLVRIKLYGINKTWFFKTYMGLQHHASKERIMAMKVDIQLFCIASLKWVRTTAPLWVLFFSKVTLELLLTGFCWLDLNTQTKKSQPAESNFHSLNAS